MWGFTVLVSKLSSTYPIGIPPYQIKIIFHIEINHSFWGAVHTTSSLDVLNFAKKNYWNKDMNPQKPTISLPSSCLTFF